MNENEERYQTLMRTAEDAICVIDAQGTFRFMNQSAAAQVGGKPDDFVGKSLAAVFPREQSELFTGYVRQAIETRKGFVTETRQTLKGQWRWHRTHVEPLFEPDGQVTSALMVARDITDTILASEAAQESEAKYCALVEQLPVITYKVKLGSQRVTEFISPQITTSLGFSPQDVYADPDHWRKHLHPADRDRVLAELVCSLENGQSFHSEYRIIAKDGQVKWFCDDARFVLAPDGCPLFQQGVMLDITDQKSAHEAARRTDELFHQLYNSSPIGMVLHDSHGMLVSANRAARAILGLPEVRQIQNYALLSDPQLPTEVRARLQAGDSARFEAVYDFDRVRRERLHDTTRTGIAHLDALMTPLTDEQTGARTGYLVQIQDVTEKKVAQESARRNDEFFRRIFDSSPIGMTLFDPQGRFVKANRAAQRIFGIREDRKDLGYSLLDDPMFAVDALARLKAGESVRFESVYDFDRVRSDRLHDTSRTGIAYLDFSITPLNDDQTGECIGYLSQVQDVTERNLAEAQVSHLSTQRQLALDAAGMGRWYYDLVKQTFTWDDRVRVIFGLEGNQAPSEEVFRRVHPDDFPLLQSKGEAAVRAPDAQPYSVEYRVQLPDGTERWVENFNIIHFEGNGDSRRPVGVYGTTRDVTERKEADKALRESRQEFQDLLQSLDDGVWAATIDSQRMLFANPAVEKIFGRSRAEFFANVNLWLDVVHPDDQILARETNNQLLKTGHADEEYRIIRPDGVIRWIRDRKTIVRDVEGTALRIGGIVRDVTNQILNQAALRESREEFNAVLNALQDSVWAASVDSQQLIYVNPASAAIYGRPNAEFAANVRLWLEVIHTEDRPRVEEAYARFLQTGHMDEEYRILRPDGVIRWVRDRKFVVRDFSGKPLRICGTTSDITYHKEADERARSYEHDLRSLTHEILRVEEAERTQLAADLHDGLSQLLSLTRIKLGALDPAQATADLPQKFGEICVLLDQAMHEARALTFELCPPVLHELGLPSAAAWLSDQMKRRFGLEVRVEENRDWKQLPKATNSILFRCLRELLVNVAKHAHATLVDVKFVQTDHLVSLSVTDNGRGFKEDFDSKKLPDSGGGNGFGLFSIRQRLEHLGGKLVIKSQPDLGSTVRLALPLNGESKVPSEHIL